jgi:hypothetical protein
VNLKLDSFQIIGYFTISTNVELQQRSVEYRTIFKQYDGMRPALLERMPVTAAPEKQQPEKTETLLDVSFRYAVVELCMIEYIVKCQ